MPEVRIKENCSWYGCEFRKGETVVVSYETYTDLAAAGKIGTVDFNDTCMPKPVPGRKETLRPGEIADRHKGETIFILGCGPSIANADLSLLDRRISIGVNAILHAYDPTYLIWLDNATVKTCGEMLERSFAVKFCADRVRTVIPATRFRRYVPKNGEPILSESFDKGLYWSRTSVFPAINLAVLFGAKRIVLLGVDLLDASHFYGRSGAGKQFLNRGRILEDFRRLAGYAKKRRLKIINASPRSAVTGFPTRTLEEICERMNPDGKLLNRL
ncbi:MAG: hypothetical protein E3J72_08080 [Planctomycetota bacterium]|nr:MAG: hypothetical protein E3J72_08080 [Planctomycetota bacterium]